jgi:hypothetical protein
MIKNLKKIFFKGLHKTTNTFTNKQKQQRL